MTLALRNSEIFSFNSLFSTDREEYTYSETNKARSLFDGAWDTCLGLIRDSSLAEPHFCWESIGSAVLAPSDYQFASLLDSDSDLVIIEDDEVILRNFCLKAYDAIEEYRTLEDGWDGDDALAPSQLCLDDAYTFLRLVSSTLDNCAEAIPMLDPEGIPSLAFDNGTSYLAIAFYGSNGVVTYRIDRTTNVSSAGEFSLDDAVHLSELISDIKAL
ncbi:hypothetical protein F0170_07460 [Pseudomonas sp. MAFF 730085]|uniref:Uncharacterized protein n=1 Tax=Pseudomonas kitaguniensis TaxID=2607908 RepID=A0A5N7JR86_9PSED|nr:hypothetical protein [Pseudomonas kitaguniensis]MPQ83835.1 hypothetical protein [Pseudomonas kitaguniensis]